MLNVLSVNIMYCVMVLINNLQNFIYISNVRFFASSSESIINNISEYSYNIDYFVKYRSEVYRNILYLLDKSVYKSDNMSYVYASIRFIDVMDFDINYVYNIGQ